MATFPVFPLTFTYSLYPYSLQLCCSFSFSLSLSSQLSLLPYDIWTVIIFFKLVLFLKTTTTTINLKRKLLRCIWLLQVYFFFCCNLKRLRFHTLHNENWQKVVYCNEFFEFFEMKLANAKINLYRNTCSGIPLQVSS